VLSLEKIKAYTSLICEQIRWKKAHPQIEEELTNHIIDQRDFHIAQGFNENEATDKAVAETGDAALIGAQLDRAHRPQPQWGMLALTAALLIIGLLIQLFFFNDSDRPWLLTNRLIGVGIGTIVMLLTYFADFSILGKYPKTIFSVITLVLAASFIVSRSVNGDIYFAGSLYYTQYLTFFFPLIFSLVIFYARNKGVGGILLCMASFILIITLTLFIPSVSGFLLFAVSGIILLSVAVFKNWFNIKRLYGLITLSIPTPFAVAFFVSIRSEIWKRLSIALHPELDALGSGYVGTLTRKALSGAKWFGLGSIPQEFDLQNTDLILTSIITLLGWFAAIVIISILLFFVIKGFILCAKQKNSLGLFISLAVMITFTVQAVLYILFNLGIQFFSPLSLPFISYGNIMTVINSGLVGFMLSVFRTGNIIKDKKAITASNENKRLTWEDGKLIINFKR